MIRNFVPNLWSKPVNPRMGVVLNFVKQKKGEPGGARSVQSLSLSLSLYFALCVFSLALIFMMWFRCEFEFLKIGQKLSLGFEEKPKHVSGKKTADRLSPSHSHKHAFSSRHARPRDI